MSRRDQARHPPLQAPSSWLPLRISLVRGHHEAARSVKWSYFYLYVILGHIQQIRGRLDDRSQRSSALAKRLIAETCEKTKTCCRTADYPRGSWVFDDPSPWLCCWRSWYHKEHSRPHVSDDNPYSEAQFKTLKYRPGFPDRFGSIQDGRSFARISFPLVQLRTSPQRDRIADSGMVHYGKAETVTSQRRIVLASAFDRPSGTVRPRLTCAAVIAGAAWINKPKVDPVKS